ncbi:odorant receptor Or1-like [Zophobas morio]|uniref:odorant receptor Or1-like n=1 Tax=Zophobas morio TaxID=2755281 RepID=UPI003083D8EB
MENFDWKTTIKINLFVLRTVGLWPKDNELYKPDFYTVYASLAAIVIIGGHNLFQLINILYVYNDIKALTRIIFVATTNFLAATKMYFFVRNLKMVKQLFVRLNSEQFRPKTFEQLKLVEPTLKGWKTIYGVYVTIVCSIVFMWSINPFLTGGVQQYELPFDAWYPVQITVSPNYEILYAYQLVCIWPISMGNINLDSLIFAVMMYIRTQCDILCDDLRKLEDNEAFNRKLISCIRHHKAILRFAQDSNNFFSVIALGQMATSTAVLALTMFQLTFVNPVSGEGLGHLLYITGITAQILLYCWFGNKVELKSSQIIYALYESKWFQQPPPVKKNFLILSIRCQRPIKLTAINLFTLSLDTFIKILRSAWSYFAVLSSVNK